MFSTPIAYIIFNRPHHTRQTFNAIRAQRPSKLFIIADGPRIRRPTDDDLCREVRKIVENIDWPCEVYHNYAKQNLGLKNRVSSGLDWVFSIVEQAIILEDDCLPHPDFFTFCESLLNRYRDDKRILVITGNNHQNGRKRGTASYYFSKYNHCWGWASWRSSWQYYRGDLPFWTEWKNSDDFQRKIPNHVERQYWMEIFDKVWRGEIDSWAYPWTASAWYYGGLTATPNVNLVSNIGFGPDATHTVTAENIEGLPVYPIGTLTHPDKIQQDFDADCFAFIHHFRGSRHKLRSFLRSIVASIFRKLSRLCANM